MTDEYMRSELPFVRPQEFDDMRARHAVRIVMETLGRAFERLGWAIANERRRHVR